MQERLLRNTAMVVKNYVQEDERGALRIGASGVSLDSVVIAFHDGLTAEAIQEQYPALNLEEVYGGITFYLANRAEVDSYLQRQEQRWQEVRQKLATTPSSVVERLRAIRDRG
jgi:uncharacterized protein (DUF433 family)